MSYPHSGLNVYIYILHIVIFACVSYLLYILVCDSVCVCVSLWPSFSVGFLDQTWSICPYPTSSFSSCKKPLPRCSERTSKRTIRCIACCLWVLPLRWHLPKVSDLMLSTWRVNGVTIYLTALYGKVFNAFHYIYIYNIYNPLRSLSLFERNTNFSCTHEGCSKRVCLSTCQIQWNAVIAVQASCYLVKPGTNPSIWSAYTILQDLAA